MPSRHLAAAAVLSLVSCAFAGAGEPTLVDHRCTRIPEIPPAWITAAKANLHIAYGHTSHGSQITTGMTGLVGFTGGCGGPQFAWNNGGTGGALDLHDYAFPGDVGYYPQWENATRAYLNDPNNSDVNVVIWSWCGQVSGYTQQDMINKYLAPMNQLEIDYPNVKFVYMTGHLDYGAMANTKARNQQIRDFCIANDKVLYDFADIESYNPDGAFFEFANDACDYWNAAGVYQGNWAVDWQNSHVQGVDWYNCSSAHSQPLNANQKAYCAWWLWARLAGWSGELLRAEKVRISAATGDTVEFWLNAGAAAAGRSYLLLGSGSGTSPGLPLPGGAATLPLNADALTTLTILMANSAVFSGFQGTLDATGHGEALLNTLGPVSSSAVGYTMHFAYALANPYDLASNAVVLEIAP
ncbi:MAG: hypothetical protein HY812_18045 [Planctomycetes bacterium]|nr:hypothetical protein [Planctomycetota bacterium]